MFKLWGTFQHPSVNARQILDERRERDFIRQECRILIDYLKKENTGYASLADPVDYTGRRRLLRSLMNVRWPGEADPEYTRIQDELLKEEAERICGVPTKPEFSEEIVSAVKWVDGTVIDVVRRLATI